MKRFNIKNLLIVTFIVSCLLLFACNDTKIELSAYEFAGLDSTYEVGEQISIEGTEIVFTFSDNSTKKVNITAAMIKELPDMSSPGEKTIKIEYEGKEYTFKINVGRRCTAKLWLRY